MADQQPTDYVIFVDDGEHHYWMVVARPFAEDHPAICAALRSMQIIATYDFHVDISKATWRSEPALWDDVLGFIPVGHPVAVCRG